MKVETWVCIIVAAIMIVVAIYLFLFQNKYEGYIGPMTYPSDLNESTLNETRPRTTNFETSSSPEIPASPSAVSPMVGPSSVSLPSNRDYVTLTQLERQPGYLSSSRNINDPSQHNRQYEAEYAYEQHIARHIYDNDDILRGQPMYDTVL